MWPAFRAQRIKKDSFSLMRLVTYNLRRDTIFRSLKKHRGRIEPFENASFRAAHFTRPLTFFSF